MADLQKEVGKKIRSLILKRGQTLEKFAYENGISKGYMSYISRGEANLTLTKLDKIAKALRVSVKDLFP